MHHRNSLLRPRRPSQLHTPPSSAGSSPTLEPHLLDDAADGSNEEDAGSIDALISKIGFGRFQLRLLILCGLGWMSDNMWMQSLSTIMPRVQQHYDIPDAYVGVMTSCMYAGMAFGAFFWGMFSDYYGRRLAFNLTLILSAVAGGVACFSPNYVFLCIFMAIVGFGVGGNVPVDGALFVEFVPKEQQYLVTALSVFCSIGAVIVSSAAWAILPYTSCLPAQPHQPKLPCDPSKNNGWRYIIGGLAVSNAVMFLARYALIKLHESPKFYLARGQPAEARRVLEDIVVFNTPKAVQCAQQAARRKELMAAVDVRMVELAELAAAKTWKQPDAETGCSSSSGSDDEDGGARRRACGNLHGHGHSSSVDDLRKPLVKRLTDAVRGNRLAPLFSPKWLRTTLLVWGIWICISAAYTMFSAFLPMFLQARGVEGEGSGTTLSEVYRGYFVFTLFAIPGPILGSYFANTKLLGRRWTMAIATVFTGAATACFALVHSQRDMMITSAVMNLFGIMVYPVLYTYTPEVFSSTVRGSACGIASALSRAAAMVVPAVTGALMTVSTTLPLWISTAAFGVCAVMMALLPFETRGRVAQ